MKCSYSSYYWSPRACAEVPVPQSEVFGNLRVAPSVRGGSVTLEFLRGPPVGRPERARRFPVTYRSRPSSFRRRMRDSPF